MNRSIAANSAQPAQNYPTQHSGNGGLLKYLAIFAVSVIFILAIQKHGFTYALAWLLQFCFFEFKLRAAEANYIADIALAEIYLVFFFGLWTLINKHFGFFCIAAVITVGAMFYIDSETDGDLKRTATHVKTNLFDGE